MKHHLPFLHLLLVLIALPSLSQENIFTAGVQYKPIFPSSFLSSGTQTVSQNKVTFSVSQTYGYCAGMVLRRGFQKNLSFETGINYTKRNFDLTVTDTSTSLVGKSKFTIIGYEIPMQGMIFLRLGKKVFMNASMGFSWDMYPSNIETQDTYFKHYSVRHSLFQLSTLANLGYEYRTEKNGYFYFGASYHLPFSYFYYSQFKYTPTFHISTLKLRGNYLTLDFRYYFHEEQLKPKTKKSKKK